MLICMCGYGFLLLTVHVLLYLLCMFPIILVSGSQAYATCVHAVYVVHVYMYSCIPYSRFLCGSLYVQN